METTETKATLDILPLVGHSIATWFNCVPASCKANGVGNHLGAW